MIPLARIITVFARCPGCHSRLRYRSGPSRWRCAQCGAVLAIPAVAPDVTITRGESTVERRVQ